MGRDLTTIPVQDYEDIYTISECGEVYRVAKRNKFGDLIPLEKPFKLSSYLYNGELAVAFNDNGVKKRFMLSRLVYTHFKGKLHKNYTVLYIDGNKMNCHADNLKKEILNNQLK